jgi:sulfofructose kinase
MSASVACVGVAGLDLIHGLPNGDRKIIARSFVEGGGMAANAAAAIARFGGGPLGLAGDDEMGLHTLSRLAAEGVDIGHVRRIAGARTSHSIVLVDQRGDRAIVLYGSEALDPDAAWLSIGDVLRDEVVLADIRWTNGAIRPLTAARKAGLSAILDAENSGSHEAIDAISAT